MSGYIHDPLQIINLIADNIRDRYKSGFSVIKEIIQNADDAGGGNSDSGHNVGEGEGDGGGGNDSGDFKCVSFEFGLSPGLSGAGHPLLKGPALFFFNNGRFTESDAVAIRSFGLNRKAIDEATIGKFGLGMKSVFHFCEAFFFMAQDEYRSYAEILNPWSGPAEFQFLHAEWDDFPDGDAEILKDHLAEIIGPWRKTSKSWFLLWVPLRSKQHLKSDGHEVGSIVAEFPGDDLKQLEFLRDHKMPRRLGRLLPLLRRIVSIRFWEFNMEGGQFKSIYRLFLGSPSSRIRFPGKPQPFFSGQVQCEKGPSSGGSYPLTYAGLEHQADDHGLKELTVSEFWPRSYVRDENGRSLQAPDKARAHCAAVFSACEDSEVPGLDICWAVFLPIETGRESIACNGNRSFDLTLHGYFFVDAGRAEVTGLFPSDVPGDGIPPANEDELRHRWNRCLSQCGTLSLVIPALVEFVKHGGIRKKEIDNLCKTLSISKTFCQNRHAICSSDQFVFRLRPDKSGWTEVRRKALLLPLPAPPETDPSRPWSTFRYLDGLERGPLFIQDDASHLLATADAPIWDEALLEKVLDIDVSAVFNNAGQLNYLCLFLSRQYVQRFVGRSGVQSRLKSILRTALKTYGQKLTQHRSRFQEIATLVLAEYRLPIDASWSTVLVTLFQCQTSVLMVPRDLDSSDLPGRAKLGVEDAVSWLQKIDELVRASMMNTEILNECRQLSRQVIENIQMELLPEVLKLVRSEIIIEAFDCKRKIRVLVSIEELISCQKRGLLFLFSQGTTDEQRIYLAPALQQAIQDRVLLISTKYAQIILGTQQGLLPCNPEGCFHALGISPLALTGVQQRTAMIKHLASASMDNSYAVRGIRYILHGNPEYFDSHMPLWTRGYQQSPVWEKMWSQLPENREGTWNLLDRSLIGHIPQNSWASIGIHEINPQEILNRFREVGFDQLDHTVFSRNERESVLIVAEGDGSLWKRVPFHESVTGKITSLPDKNVFLESNLTISDEFQDRITIIRISENQRVRDAQHRYIPILDNEGLIRILLESREPHEYWQEILDALQRGGRELLAKQNLRELLRERSWLRDTRRRAVRPSDVLHLPPIADEVCRLSEQIEGTYIAPELINSDIREHPYWAEVISQYCATGDDAMDKLGLLLGESPTHAIGEIRFKDEKNLKSLIDVFRNIHAGTSMPGWDVLADIKSAYGVEKSIRHILSNIRQALSVDAVVAMLHSLKISSENCSDRDRKAVIDAFECYLDVFVRTPKCFETLPSINLLNANERWRYARELCADAEGVAPENLIHDRQKAILRPIIRSAGDYEIERGGVQEDVFEEDVYVAVEETPKRLKLYFAAWEDRIPPNLIRAFLAFLGDDTELGRLAETYEGSHSIEWIRTKLQWVSNMQLDRDGRRGWLYELNQEETMKKHRFIVEPVLGQTVQVRSICGQVITARLSEDFDSLIVGGLWYEWPRDNLIFPKIRLRQIDVYLFSAEKLSTLLRKTAEYLLRHAFCQANHDLGDLWNEIGEGEQLDIPIAQLLVMKHIPYYLRQLGTQRNEKLMKVLKLWNDARYRVAEFSQNPKQRPQFEKNELKALETLQDLLINDREVQETVLEAVRSKIRDFQYSPASILFELFQNADDAVVELAEIISYPDQLPIFTDDAVLPIPARRFVLRKTADHLSVMHWGRPVNHAGGSGFPGRERGFHQDLEKMLILSSSDKPISQGGVTGKFGLGFKSVFLITNVPKLVSGRLQVEILAGMYPKQLENPTPLIAVLKEEAPEARTAGTLIDLHLDLGAAKEVCAPFEKWAALFAVFARGIRRLEVDDGGRCENYEWAPFIAFATAEAKIEYGTLRLEQNGSEGKISVLHFRLNGGGGLLVGIGPNGFRELPNDVPAIWVLAPTQEDIGLGFAINGAFEVDAGRTRLSSSEGSTTIESRRIGGHVATGLVALFDEASKDWDRFRELLRLGSELRPYEFWASVWQVLTGAFNRRLDGKVERIVKCVMTDEKGLGCLVRNRRALPNGLWGDTFRTLTRVGDVKYALRGAISQEPVFKHIANLDVFRQKIKPSEVVSNQVFEVLRKVSSAFSENTESWQSLKISTVLNWLAETDYRMTPSTAAVMGRVITGDLLGELSATTAGQNEALEILGILRRIKFQNKVGNWTEPRHLLVSRPTINISDDEPLRAAFAPKTRIVEEIYDDNGIMFLTVCRGKMEAPVEEMVSWILDASDTATRFASLRYLLDGELGDRLSSRLREVGFSKTWLDELDRRNDVFDGWDENEIDEILYRRLPSIEQLRRMGNDFREMRSGQPRLDPADVLPRIHKWWSEEAESLIGQFEKCTYPESRVPDLRENDNGSPNRANWLVLFLLGAFHTFGRSRKEQHRDFIHLCQQKGWWDTFAAESPETRADQWMRILDEYIDTQVDESEYELWMNRFPTIYRIARYLDDYMEAFLSIDRHETLSDLGGITVTRVNPLFQGGGISAPPIRRSFGIGACFVVRELKRVGLLTSPIATPHCYVPVARVRKFMFELGCDGLSEDEVYPEDSKIIHTFLCKHLGEDKAEFQGACDIPLQILTEKRDLQVRLLGRIISEE